MKQAVSQLAKHSGIYGIGLVLSKAIGFFMIPVYTRYLAPSDYGILEMLDLLVFFTGLLMAMGMYGAVFRFYALEEDEEGRRKVISTALVYSACVSVLFSAGLFIFSAPIAQVLLGRSDLAPLIQVVSGSLLFTNLSEVPLARWRVQQRTILFAVVNLLRTVCGISLLIYFIAIRQSGVWGAVWANLINNAVFGLVLFADATRASRWRLDAARLKEMLRYGAPLVVPSLASFVLVFSDRFFLRQYASLSEVGVYSLGYKIAAVVTLVVSLPLGMTWQWQQFELAKQADARQLYARIQTYWLLVAVFIGLAASLLAGDLLRIVSPESYWSAAAVVPWIALSYVLADARQVVLSGVFVERVTQRLIPVALTAAACNLILNYLLVPRYQILGAALATVLSYAVSLALTHRVAQRTYFVPYDYRRNGLILGAAAVAYAAGQFHHLSLAPSIAVNLLLLGLFALVAYRLLTPDERELVRQMGGKLGRRLDIDESAPEKIG